MTGILVVTALLSSPAPPHVPVSALSLLSVHVFLQLVVVVQLNSDVVMRFLCKMLFVQAIVQCFH